MKSKRPRPLAGKKRCEKEARRSRFSRGTEDEGGRPVGQGGSPARRPFEVLVVCRPEVLRAGISRMLADAPQLSVTAAESVPQVGRRGADVAVLCDRGLSDPGAAC